MFFRLPSKLSKRKKDQGGKSDYEQLKEDYEKKLLQRCNSLLLENFELKQKTHLN